MATAFETLTISLKSMHWILWEFNTQHRRDDENMIFICIIKLLDRMTAADSDQGRIKETYFICLFIAPARRNPEEAL